MNLNIRKYNLNLKMKLRKAIYEDLPSIYNLVVELAIFEKEPDAVKATLQDYQEHHKNGLIDIIVAEDEGAIIGMALYYDTFSTWRGKMLYLEDFVVNHAYRGKGVGSLIYDEFIEEAKRRKCTMVKWQVLDWNDGAVRFYEQKGATIEKGWWNVKVIF